MSFIPNELKININTSIPGYQNIRYTPNMTIPNEKSNSVQFNPLVKLRKSVIDSVPKNIRVREFFDRGLFQSLINAHGLVTAKSLYEATKEGFVDNNISLTLKELFPLNGVIYIANQPYAIAGVLWDKGTWRINSKVSDEQPIDFRNVNDPYLYNQLIYNQKILGDKELTTLPNAVIYGPNYIPPETPLITPKIEEIKTEKPSQPPKPVPSISTQIPLKPPEPPIKPIRPTITPIIQPEKPIKPPQPQQPPQPPQPPKPSTELVVKPPIKPTRQPLQITSGPSPQTPLQITNVPSTKPTKQPLQITNGPSSKPPLQITNAPSTNSPLQIQDNSTAFDQLKKLGKVDLSGDKKIDKDIRNFFKDSDYYQMLNLIYKYSNNQIKKIINSILRNTTNIDVQEDNKSLSSSSYQESISNIFINKNIGGGDCFFKAVADGLNNYNFNIVNDDNITNKIDKLIFYDNKFGLKEKYTTSTIRQIVMNYILNNNLNEKLDIVKNLSDQLNDEFQQFKDNIDNNKSLNQDEKIKELNIFIEDLYSRDRDFLIKKPELQTNFNNPFFTPFTIYNNLDAIKEYMMSSNYWAGEEAIKALENQLNIGFVIISNQKRDNSKIYNVIYISNLKSIKNYLFLYFENQHYNLFSFKYKIPTQVRKGNIINTTKKENILTIFNNDSKIIPPLVLIFLIFGSNYINIYNIQNRTHLLNYILNPLENIFNSIILNQISDTEYTQDQINDNRKKFIESFDYYFGSRTIDLLLKRNTNRIGGALLDNQRNNFVNLYNPQYNPQFNPQYNPQFNQRYNPRFNYNRFSPYNQVNKTVNLEPVSNISYYITIELILQKGTQITGTDFINLKCNQQYNKIRKNYADLFGLKYVIPPIYNNIPSYPPKNKTQNITKKVGGNKHNKTVKQIIK